MNERALIQKLEDAEPDELAAMMQSVSGEEERVLRKYLGDDVFNSMRELAPVATRAAKRGNVVVLHGIMGSDLSWAERAGTRATHIWLNIWRLIRGDFTKLALNGASGVEIKAMGILKRYYGEQILSLMKDGWDVRTFAYDWRLDIDDSSKQLANQIRTWFNGQPVHLVAHSMGGLVSRNFIRLDRNLWESMWDKSGQGAAGGRLLMLGTPNHGSFAIPQLLHGLNDVVRKIAIVDLRHNPQELVDIIKDFIGPFQMLPSPLIDSAFEQLYSGKAYPHLKIDPKRFERALQFHKDLADVIDPARMIYVAGYDQATYGGVKDFKKLSIFDGYMANRLGDGTVPHSLGMLKGVPTFYTRIEHGALPNAEVVRNALSDLLQNGTTEKLLREVPAGVRGAEDSEEAARELLALQTVEEAELLALAEPLKASARSRGTAAEDEPVSSTERQVENLLVRSFLMGGKVIEGLPRDLTGVDVRSAMGDTATTGPVRVEFVLGDIGGSIKSPVDGQPAEVVSVGHYIGVRPTAAELALDKMLSRAVGLADTTDPGDRVLTSFTDRGIIRGELGQPFFLEFPEPDAADAGGVNKRTPLIAVAGMGFPGRFGTPELTVMVRELIWSLGKLGRTRLATVLIGSGQGNLSVRDCVAGWIEGMRRALMQSSSDPSRRLQVLTIVDREPDKLYAIWTAFLEARKTGITLEIPDAQDAGMAKLREQALEHRRKQLEKQLSVDGNPVRNEERDARSEAASRVTVEVEGQTYLYGAITEIASVPQRAALLDLDLIREANESIATSKTAPEQRRLGEYLLKYLIPFDLRKELETRHPLVMIVDSQAARVHWEMISQPDSSGMGPFLGLHRGLTRQLKTLFAPPPEPPPPPSRMLKVLVVGDPADNLEGAKREAQLVADMFRKLKEEEGQHPPEQRRVLDVKITPLIGRTEATRTRVMMELLLENYDILHFCGHCEFKPDIMQSGWIFDGGRHLSAAELSRVDQIPRFVFSNACESGITNDSEQFGSNYALIAPSFAEAFFARGVHNFICTGWPVNDQAGLEFAERFYTLALGLSGREPEPLHVALREAREAIAKETYGIRTWGAYQHYGNPYSRLIARRPGPAA
jgi:hypothetical protein